MRLIRSDVNSLLISLKCYILAPINIAYTTKHKYTFKVGYFFSIAPGYYKKNEYGIRLKNVLEVVDTGETHPSNSKFLKFQDTTLIPFDHGLIDKTLMSVQEVGHQILFILNFSN